MRLLYVCSDHGIPSSGTKGASVHLRAITRALADCGHEVRLLSPHPGPDAPHPLRRLRLPERTPVDAFAAELKRWLGQREFDPAVAREFRSLAFNAWALEPALEFLGTQPADAVIERLSLFGHLGLDLATRLNLPLVVEVNALLTEEARRFRALHLQTLAEQIELRVLHRADAVLAVSSALADRLAALGVARTRLHVVPNGADVEPFMAAPPQAVCRAKLGLGEEFVVGFTGSLKVWHGVDVLLTAFARLHARRANTRLLIVGTGPTEAELRGLAHRLGLDDAVIFTGALSHAQIPELLRAMDVAVAPFLPVDGFYFSPIKLFEYMAAGVCVVASRIGQIADLLRDGVNGLLCTAGEVTEIEGALERAYAAPELRARLAAAALRLVREQYTWKHTAEHTLRVLQAARTRPEIRSDRTDRSPTTTCATEIAVC